MTTTRQLEVLTGGQPKPEEGHDIRQGAGGEGGIFRDVDALPGTETFNLYDSDGKRIGCWTAVAGATDDELLVALGELLLRRDSPGPTLSIS